MRSKFFAPPKELSIDDSAFLEAWLSLRSVEKKASLLSYSYIIRLCREEMGPKKEPPKSKKQLRKEELERQKEAQRVAEEAEKKRLEQEEIANKERARLRKIEEERLAKEEAERLYDEEKTEIEAYRKFLAGSIYSAEQNLNKFEEWDKFTVCDSQPDPTNEADLTTFLTQFSEMKKISNLRVEEVLNQIQLSEDIVSKLEEIWMKSKADNNKEKEDWCVRYRRSLRELASYKFEEITSHLAINADILVEEKKEENNNKKDKDNGPKSLSKDDKQKQEILKIYPNYKSFRYGLWINPNAKPGYRHKPVDFLNLDIQCEVPRSFMTTAGIMKVCWTSYDLFSIESAYSKDSIIGGVLDIECFVFLPPPRKTAGWTLKYDYEIKDSLQKQASQTSEGNPAAPNFHNLKIYYTLPGYVYIHPNDKIRVAVWDKEGKRWSSDFTDDLKYDPDKKILQFATSRLAPVAYIQDRCIDFPYQYWKLRCVDNEKAFLDLQGRRQLIKFEIGPDYVMLRHKNEPELAHLVNKKMKPGTLLKELLKCGINLLPVEQDAYTASITSKDMEAENYAIQDISLAVRSFFIKSSKWNNSLSTDKVMVRIRENMEFDEEFAEEQDKEWKSIVWWKNKCAAIKARDTHERLNEDFLDKTVTHSILEVLLRKHQLSDSYVIDRMKDLSYIVFSETLKRFLKLTHILTFTSD